MTNRDHKVTGRRKKRRRPAPHHSTPIPNDVWDRVRSLSERHPKFAGTRVPIGRACVIMLNERLLQLEFEMTKEAS